jgi:tight adherence protein C
MEILLKTLPVLFVMISIFLYIVSIQGIRSAVPGDKREYMDPLPPLLRKIWPLVLMFAYWVGEMLPVDLLEKYNKKLKQSGLIYLMTPEQFVGLRIVSAVVWTLIVLTLMLLLENFSWLYLVLGAILGFYLPSIKLNDKKKNREKAIVKALPIYLDYLTMAVQAGMNLSGAIQQAVDKGPDGPLRVEFSKVIRDIRAGMSRVDAIRSMAERLDIREINAFSTTVVQAEKTGASIGSTLKIQADQRRVERFQRAEKLAMEAPVKLIFPLVAFIFPMTFMILAFPIAMKFLYDI